MFSRFETIPVCDGRTDRQTDRQTSCDSIGRAMIASRGNQDDPRSTLHVSSNRMRQRKCALFEITERHCIRPHCVPLVGYSAGHCWRPSHAWCMQLPVECGPKSTKSILQCKWVTSTDIIMRLPLLPTSWSCFGCLTRGSICLGGGVKVIRFTLSKNQNVSR